MSQYKITKEKLKELEIKHPATQNTDKFLGHYIQWRPNRINKLIQILGKEWFKGKEILELACGYGYIGKELMKLGSIVTFAEGKEHNISHIAKDLDIDKTDIYLLDQDKRWNLNKKFDLVIHWGVSYHLDNWRRDLKIAIDHGKIVSFENEVLDSNKENIFKEIKVNEQKWFEGAKNGLGTRASVASIEYFLDCLCVDFKRYDDTDLNCDSEYGWKYVYDWKDEKHICPPETDFYDGLRRFWMIYP